MTDPINIADEYEKRARGRYEKWGAAFKPLPVEEEKALDRLLGKAPWAILKYGPKALRTVATKVPGILKTVFIGMAWGLEKLSKRFRIE